MQREPLRLTAEQRRDQLVSAARDVFIRHGLSGARTRTIAEYAGVSEALLYQHFASKEELFAAAILAPLERLTETLASQCERLPSLAGPQRRANSVEIHTAVLDSMTEIAPLLGLALFSSRSAGRVFYTEQVHPLLERAVKSFGTALAGWEHPAVRPETLVSMIFGTYFWVAVQRTFDGAGGAADDAADDGKALVTEVTNLLVRAMSGSR